MTDAFDASFRQSLIGIIVEPTAKITINKAFRAISHRSEALAHPPLPTNEGR